MAYTADVESRIRDRLAERSKQELARKQNHIMLTKPPPHNWKYDITYVELGCDIEDATGKIILNPRAIDNPSLEVVDFDWRADLAAYRDLTKYLEDEQARRFHIQMWTQNGSIQPK